MADNQSLALVLTKPIEELIPAMIDFNEAQIISAISEKVEAYKTARYTEDTIKQAKADRANFNKFVEALNKERIAIGKAYAAPYDVFKSKVDKIIEYANGAVDNIDGQLKAFEEKRLADRKDFCRAHWYLIAGEEFMQKVPYEKVEDKKWLLASTSEKKARELIEEVYGGIQNDLQTIGQLQSESVDALTLYYFNTLDLNSTLRENERRKAEERKIAEMKAQREAAEQARREREEADRMAQEEARRQAEARAIAEAPEAPAVPVEFVPPVEVQAEEEAPKTTAHVIRSVRFEVFGTIEQLKKLQTFLRENGLKYKSI